MKINTTSLPPSVPITVPAAASEKLAIVIPTQKFKLNYIEEEVLNRISQLYSDIYSLYLVVSEYSPINYENKGFKNIYLDPIFFIDASNGNNSLCLDVNFYKIFENYNYTLIHHLDSIILKDEVEYWISKNYSYIGGPSIHKNFLTKEPLTIKYFCNGGLSLRKNSDFIKVLNSKNIYFNNLDLSVIKELINFKYTTKYLYLFYKNYQIKNYFDVQNFAKKYFLNEDTFWTILAKLFIKDFRLPDNTLECANFCIDRGHEFYATKHRINPFGIHGYTEKNAPYLKELFKI